MILLVIGWDVAVAGEGVPIGVIGIGTQGTCVCVRVRSVVGGRMAHMEMYARKTCTDSG